MSDPIAWPAPEPTLVAPFIVRYAGKDANRHVLDALALGRSLDGGARLYGAIAHCCFFGEIPGRRYARRFTCYAQPAQPGSWDQFLYIAPVLGHYHLHAELYNKAFSIIFGRVSEAIKQLWTKPNETTKVAERLATTIETIGQQNSAVMEQMAAGLVRGNDNLASVLLEVLPLLAAATRPAASRFVEPVGRTCESMIPFAGSDFSSEIGQAEAHAIQAGPTSEVRDMATYTIERISGINVDTGTCQLELEGAVGPIRGKITDPVLQTPHNPYTEALNRQGRLLGAC